MRVLRKIGLALSRVVVIMSVIIGFVYPFGNIIQNIVVFGIGLSFLSICDLLKEDKDKPHLPNKE